MEGLSDESCWEATSTQVAARARSGTKGQGQKETKARRERHPLMSGRMVKTISHLGKPMRRLQVSSLVLSADTRGTVNETGKPGKESRNKHEISGHPTKVDTIVPMLSTVSWERESI